MGCWKMEDVMSVFNAYHGVSAVDHQARFNDLLSKEPTASIPAGIQSQPERCQRQSAQPVFEFRLCVARPRHRARHDDVVYQLCPEVCRAVRHRRRVCRRHTRVAKTIERRLGGRSGAQCDSPRSEFQSTTAGGIRRLYPGNDGLWWRADRLHSLPRAAGSSLRGLGRSAAVAGHRSNG
jgi:hypothetical protein